MNDPMAMMYAMLSRTAVAADVAADAPAAAEGPRASLMLPPPASSFAPATDWLFNFIIGVSGIFFVLIIGLMVFFAIKYRRRYHGQMAASQVSHSTALELGWSLPPVFIVFFIFYKGLVGYMDMSTPPENAYNIDVTARKWSWTFAHPNGFSKVDEKTGQGVLEIPRNEPIRFTIYSEDVLHSFWAPAFRVKKDAVPGRFNTTWFETDAPAGSEYYILCTEYCGDQHSVMAAKVVVQPEGWRPPKPEIPWSDPPRAGRMIFFAKGCAACHKVDGQRLVGPPLNEVYGKTRQFTDGSSAQGDEAYIRESILQPMAKLVAAPAGQPPYPPGMPVLPMSDREMEVLIAYIKSLSEESK